MIMQISNHLVDCPICGRPVEVQSECISRDLACGHCRGQFTVYDAEDGELTAIAMDGVDTVERAEELLWRTERTTNQGSTHLSNRLLQFFSAWGDTNRCQDRPDTLLASDKDEAVDQPIVLLVEHRDEVFARVAIDMAKAGTRVLRADSATEALSLCVTYKVTLVVANLDLPDQSGWLLAGKLRFVDHGVRIWLYQSESSDDDFGMANFLNIDALLDYRGDLFGLSESIVEHLSRHLATFDTAKHEKTAAAG